jgi:hypothetical protein
MEAAKAQNWAVEPQEKEKGINHGSGGGGALFPSSIQKGHTLTQYQLLSWIFQFKGHESAGFLHHFLIMRRTSCLSY